MDRIRVDIPILRRDFQRARQPLSLGVAATAREEADWIEDGLERQHRHEFVLIRSLIKIAIYCPQGSGTLRQQSLMMH